MLGSGWPVDIRMSRHLRQEADGAEQALQVRGDLRGDAEKRCRAPHCGILLLG